MKKTMLLAIAAVMAMPVFMMTACSGEDPWVESSYSIEITKEGNGIVSATVDGNGVSDAKPGETVTITAVPESVEYRFIGWVAVGDCIELPNPMANPMVITMPGGPVGIMARFELKPFHFIRINEIEHGEVEVSVNGYKGGNVAREGTIITITAKPYPHSTFYRWNTSVELEDRSAGTATFLMPDADVYIGAEFDPEYLDLLWHFPDENFRKIVAQYDKDGDSRLSPAERMAMADVTYLNVSGGNSATGEYKPESELISDLTGIEHFTGLRTLRCHNNKLTSLDVSANTNLEDLACDGNRLNYLNITQCAQLRYLFCRNNELATLDLSGNIRLESIWCEGNPFTSLDVSPCYQLGRLFCYDTHLTSLDVSKNSELCLLWCGAKNSGSIQPIVVTVKPDATLERLIVDGSEIAVYAYNGSEDVMISEFGPAGMINGVTVVKAAE